MPQSPWQQDAEAFGNLGNAMNRAIIGLAQARARQGQNMQMLAVRQALEQAQQKHLSTQDDELLQRIAESKASMSAAQKLYDAVKAQNMPPMVNQQFDTIPGPQAPDPLGIYSISAPTRSQEGLNNAEVLATRALVAALAGNPQRGDPTFHNIGQNDVAINAVTGQQTPGPIVLSPGGMYDLQGQQTVNERPFSIPAGAQPVDRFGQPIGPQTPFNPRPPGNQGIPSFHPGSQYGGAYIFDPRTMTAVPIIESGTNAPVLGAPITVPGQTNQPVGLPQVSGRVRVKAPNGSIGTVPAEQLQQALQEGYIQVQ